MEERLGSVLAALYAPGVGKAPERRWPEVVRAIRRAGEKTSSSEALERAGLTLEALLVGERPHPRSPDLLTAVDPPLETVWPLAGRIARGLATSAVEATLDAPALPPAIWACGVFPETRTPTLAGIGCRAPSPEADAFARSVGQRLARTGGALVSGGAEGCDTAFASGHGAAVVVLPHGLDAPRDLPGAAARLSPFSRSSTFGRERAMRRNALIVAAADLTLVASARLREGGSWHAAMSALRRRAPLAVYVGPGEGSGAQALVALGALPIKDVDEAIAALDMVRTLPSDEDAATRWARLRGVPDERLQTTLSFV